MMKISCIAGRIKKIDFMSKTKSITILFLIKSIRESCLKYTVVKFNSILHTKYLTKQKWYIKSA